MACRSRYIDDPSLSVAERDARRQVGMLRGFYHHLMVFIVVNCGLVAINLIASPGRNGPLCLRLVVTAPKPRSCSPKPGPLAPWQRAPGLSPADTPPGGSEPLQAPPAATSPRTLPSTPRFRP